MDLVSSVPASRIVVHSELDVNTEGEFVLYWMTSARRTTFNFSLDRAIAWAAKLKKPLVVLEPLRSDYEWASDRFHRFVIEGMKVNSECFASSNICYWPFVEKDPEQSHGLLQTVMNKAAVVITDEYPCFFLRTLTRFARRLARCRMESVDANGILPMRSVPKIFSRAFDFRRFWQKNLPDHLSDFPESQPLRKATKLPSYELPAAWLKKWPRANFEKLLSPDGLSSLPIDHSVTVTNQVGGSLRADELLSTFVRDKILRYGSDRNEPSSGVSSDLSPYLHFGHIGAHAILDQVLRATSWQPSLLSGKAHGKNCGWWGLDDSVEGFLDQLITWREIGFNMCFYEPNYEKYSSLPDWVRKTLEKHKKDKREYIYSLGEFERAETHDELWNAAQRELVLDGRIHNYLRMVWGKKILEWSATPEEALQIMVHLNNKYALDGRDPNSYTGIFWVLGRYDRPWAPERPVFGQIRFMSSANTARKIDVKPYLRKFGNRLPRPKT